MTRIIEMEINEIEVPKDMFKEIPMMTSAYLYMLSKETIAISLEKSQDMAQKSIWNDKIDVKETKNAFIFCLPQLVTNFYHITPNNFSVSVSQKTDIIYVDID
ncbi:hypothetical protein [Candidatus Borrarchaeum sp.]|uniref:hypothetical protein n=1 Tax=Candidatus Borrarchaeum sp. TaxID=2846742 RepID=UPI00257C1045|nr:hypothetical protein [Candidatus Borrarchaeum sp.]